MESSTVSVYQKEEYVSSTYMTSKCWVYYMEKDQATVERIVGLD